MLTRWRCAAQGWDEDLIQDALAAGRDAAREELDWEEAALADPTRRSLPGDSLRRYTPPRFASEVIQGIRQGAAKLFKARPCLPSTPDTAWQVFPAVSIRLPSNR